MSHSDDRGLVLPPAIAPYHVVIVPIWKTEEDKELVQNYIWKIIEGFTTKVSTAHPERDIFQRTIKKNMKADQKEITITGDSIEL